MNKPLTKERCMLNLLEKEKQLCKLKDVLSALEGYRKEIKDSKTRNIKKEVALQKLEKWFPIAKEKEGESVDDGER